jgi:Cu+-exporting ATPase
MNSLITMGVMASYVYSLVISANHLFKFNISALNNSHEVYYETAAMIISFILIGHYLESVLKSKTQTSIKKLKQLQSKIVTVIRNNEEIQISYKKVKENDIVIIKTGDIIPVDGIIKDGYCVADESAMTGESLLIEKKPGDKLMSGTILKNGFVKMIAEKVGKDTMLSKIITLVKDASNSKPQIQRIADKVAAIFVPVVIAIAILTFVIWNFIIGAPFDRSLLYAVSVLIIACPCALGLASPMAVVIGVGRSAESGILFNNVEAIEKLNKIDTVCFDKTGTLTAGKMTIKNVTILNGLSETDFMKYVYSVEKYSNHPIAKSIEEYCINNGIDALSDVKELINENGLGVTASVSNIGISIGNERLMKSKGIEDIDTTTSDKSVMYIAFEKDLAGYIEFEDKLKPESVTIVKKLIDESKNVFMISGDNEQTTKNIAGELGIKDFSYKTLPDEKEQIISNLQSEGKNVAMVGDGINDAPSLTRANVGVAMGTGQDIAIDSADVILVRGDLRNLLKAIKISHKTVSIIKQNIFWAFFYNAIAIPLAAGLLSPAGIIISPVMAAMFMAFSDVITVMINSLRLKFVNID